jgi:hypothetical protein
MNTFPGIAIQTGDNMASAGHAAGSPRLPGDSISEIKQNKYSA